MLHILRRSMQAQRQRRCVYYEASKHIEIPVVVRTARNGERHMCTERVVRNADGEVVIRTRYDELKHFAVPLDVLYVNV